VDGDIVTRDLSFEDTHSSDILSVITLIFGEVRSGLKYDLADRLTSSRIPPVLLEGYP
jgi:hypothetical protein